MYSLGSTTSYPVSKSSILFSAAVSFCVPGKTTVIQFWLLLSLLISITQHHISSKHHIRLSYYSTSLVFRQARSAIERIIASEGSGGPPPRGPGMGMGGGGGGPPGGGGGFYEQMIAGHKVGLIIGKGGETIKQLQEQSGAKIVIIQDSPEAAQEKPLRITGTPDAVEHAKQLVFEIIGAPGQDNVSRAKRH